MINNRFDEELLKVVDCAMWICEVVVCKEGFNEADVEGGEYIWGMRKVESDCGCLRMNVSNCVRAVETCNKFGCPFTVRGDIFPTTVQGTK
jgi:hypothetical protein